MRVQGMMWAIVVATAVSGSNAFAEGAAAPATNPPAAEISAPPPELWKGGAQAIPFLGLNSTVGDAGKGSSVGFRFGSLFGGRFGENWSMNGELVLDVLSPANGLPGQNASAWNGDLALAPLYHYPLAQVELVAGPSVGTFFTLGRLTSSAFSETIWSYGWTLGANAGAFVPLRNRKAIGVLFNFIVHEPLKSCTDDGKEMCFTSNLSSTKMLGFSLAGLL